MYKPCVCPAAWDSMAGTPWYSYCSGDKSSMFCDTPAVAASAAGVTPVTAAVAGRDLDFTHANVWANPNWCQVPWCYVKKSCGTWVPTSVFEAVEGAGAIGYSYQTCGGTDCYSADGWGMDANGVSSADNCPWKC